MQRSKSLLILLLCMPLMAWSQVSPFDSLKSLLQETKKDRSRVSILNEISNSIFSTSPDEAISYGKQAKELALELKDSVGLAYALKNIGLGYYIRANYIEVTLNWEQSLAIFEAIDDDLGSANLLSNLGVVYADQGDDAKAIDYYLRSLRLSEKIGDSLRIATALGNVGYVYAAKEATRDKALGYFQNALKIGEVVNDVGIIGTSASNLGDYYFVKRQYDSALYYLDKSLKAFVGTSDESLTLNLIGKVYASKGEYDLAINYQKQAIEISTSFNAQFDLAEAQLGLANTYEQKGEHKKAILVYLSAQEIAKEVGADYILKDVYEGLASSYAQTSDFRNAFIYQKLFDVVKDSIYNTETDDKIKTLQFSYEIDKKEVQIDLLTKDQALKEATIQRQKIVNYAAGVTGFLLLLVIIGFYNRYRYVRKTNKIIKNERDRSQELLLNILPEETARELEIDGFAQTRFYENVTVLFTDFKGFSTIAGKLSPQDLVAELNDYFIAFDEIVEKHNLEKIKTIGDAYMCAGGIPTANETNALDAVEAALEMQAFMGRRIAERKEKGLVAWELRIGIHTGPIVAGVVGKKKYAYDIWGDTVNVASRMESNGEPGKVNISSSTFEKVKAKFECLHRGKISAKNIGEVDMYFVEEKIGVSVNV